MKRRASLDSPTRYDAGMKNIRVYPLLEGQLEGDKKSIEMRARYIQEGRFGYKNPGQRAARLQARRTRRIAHHRKVK